MEIYKKLFQAKKELGKISKDSTNPFFKSKYFDINQLLEHVEPILQKHDLLLLQPVKKGYVSTVITDPETQDYVDSEIELPQLNDPQKIGIAITYYRRYTLQSLLGLQAEDTDGNGITNAEPKKETRKIETWLSEDQFHAAMKSDKKGITATISAYTSGSKGMKKDYLTKLSEQLKKVS